MEDKKQLKELAKIFRETAEVIDEIVENTDKELEDELLGKFVVKIMKLQNLQELL